MGTTYTQEMMTEAMYNKLATLTALVDADSIVYRSGFAADSQLKKEYKETVNAEATKEELAAYLETVDYTHIALHNAKETLKGIASLFDEQKMRVFLTGKSNYRDDVASVKQYKGNRDPTHKPKYYKELRDYLVSVWHAEVVEGMEADDKVSILQWEAKDKSTIIVSIDKDLANTPGHHYNQNRHEYKYVTKTEADYNFWKQVLTGDATDNILGCAVMKAGVYKTGKKAGQSYIKRSGVGPVEADTILARSEGQYSQAVLGEYEKLYGENAYSAMHENATLLWMQRDHNINYDGSLISEYEYKEYDYGNSEEESSTEDCIEGQHPVGSEQAQLADVAG